MMMLKVTSIRERGNLDKERVVMKAESTTDIGDYLLLNSGYKNGSVTNRIGATYWFPDKEVNAGDFVILYTKKGTDSEKPFNNVKSHFFYWGKDEPLWTGDDNSAVLMYAPIWESFKPEVEEPVA